MTERYTPNEIEPAHEEKSKELKKLDDRYTQLIKEYSLLNEKLGEAKWERRKDIKKEMSEKMKEIKKIEEFMKLNWEYEQLKDYLSSLEERSILSEWEMKKDTLRQIEKTKKEIQDLEWRMKELMPYNAEEQEIIGKAQRDLELLKKENYDDTRIV